MGCTASKVIQVVYACISGTTHHGTQRLWNCSDNHNGIQYTWTEWRMDGAWVNTGGSCLGPPTDTSLEYTQVALTGQAMEPTHQRLHQYCLIVPGVGPQLWLGWVEESI